MFGRKAVDVEERPVIERHHETDNYHHRAEENLPRWVTHGCLSIVLGHRRPPVRPLIRFKPAPNEAFDHDHAPDDQN